MRSEPQKLNGFEIGGPRTEHFPWAGLPDLNSAAAGMTANVTVNYSPQYDPRESAWNQVMPSIAGIPASLIGPAN